MGRSVLRRPRPVAQSGFSLVETVAALGILAIAALPLLQTTRSAAESSRRLESRMLARTVAENVLSFEIVRPDAREGGRFSGTEMQMGRRFDWVLQAGPRVPGETQVLIVEVSRSGETQVLAQLRALRGHSSVGILPGGGEG